MTQLLEARAGREGSTVGCGDFAASERRRIVQAKAAAIESLALAERCSWSELSRRSVCRVKVAAALAKAAAISTLGYVYKRLKAQLRRLEPKALLWGSRARWPRHLVNSPQAPS